GYRRRLRPTGAGRCLRPHRRGEGQPAGGDGGRVELRSGGFADSSRGAHGDARAEDDAAPEGQQRGGERDTRQSAVGDSRGGYQGAAAFGRAVDRTSSDRSTTGAGIALGRALSVRGTAGQRGATGRADGRPED